MIYFDHAASSYPKPKKVAEAMSEAVLTYSANPGRGGHRLAEQARLAVEGARKKVAQLFSAPSSKNVWFYQNATMAINQAILGFPFKKGDHVITTMFEHNSVIRPLKQLMKEKEIDVSFIEPNASGLIVAENVIEEMTNRTVVIAITHASNVTGAVVPIRDISTYAKQKNVVLFVDASQTAGTLPLSMEEDHIDLLAFAGHKSLLGPQGTGVLISKNDYGLTPLIVGGTGSYSELPYQPQSWPDRYEAGTLNTPGIVGLAAGIDEINRRGLDDIYEHEQSLLKHFVSESEKIEGLKLVGPTDLTKRVAVASFTLDGLDSHEVAMILDEHYHIAVRAGLHCAPIIHQALGTVDTGLIRVSFGPYNKLDEIDTLIQALQDISEAF
ncbi:aminotransferase class V-fold PLP-dependent enzyme [Halalkalibacter sp. APA_J-10(15)]|uniref:aminotransferase class V-fold PLP-dependent enzyme n=1 Tax=Halalkalibacter sp. APA_J-10(15) TaxID=2933805 RepID=UPI001FF4CB9C|nr:aminotransferase class V-fold PLP-dependent enzyme [Halalkalibacter sp. APA_J-10(15)]MCK0469796.1 aminotransferase class V-fold PLP-dependent enzyme [Halalkalibacter sp. APA_J-10(15)]